MDQPPLVIARVGVRSSDKAPTEVIQALFRGEDNKISRLMMLYSPEIRLNNRGPIMGARRTQPNMDDRVADCTNLVQYAQADIWHVL